MSAFNTETFVNPDTDFPYNPPSKRCQPIIDFTSMRFHDSSISNPITLFEDSDLKFGIVDIKIRDEIPITNKHIHLFCTIDASGSMSDKCIDGRTKMAHIHHTLENILRIFHGNPECEISIHVQSFDTIITEVIVNIPNILQANLEELVTAIYTIRPGGSTNIERALTEAKLEIEKYNAKNPEHQVVHIFLTDGDITDGTNDFDELLNLVPKNASNIFIGYGAEHDSALLSHLASHKNDEYRFIDALEKAGLVYGEVIHSILYKAIEDVTLKIVNGEIYNYVNNTWCSELEIGNLLSDQLKTFHIRSASEKDCKLTIIGKTIIKTRQHQIVNVYEEQREITPIQDLLLGNLNVYIFRQRTQELLYESRKVSEGRHNRNYSYSYLRPLELPELEELNPLEDKIKVVKDKLNSFHKTMLDFMKDNDLETNPIMKMLCDDIYIAYKTTGTSIGNMYTCARQTSNGRQHTYMCSATVTQQTLRQPKNRRGLSTIPLLRQTNAPGAANIMDNELDSYIPSQDFLSPFTSDGVVTMMRDVSGNQRIGTNQDIEDEDNLSETQKIH
jgi:hypothetical protein